MAPAFCEVEFNSPQHGRSVMFDFGDAWDKSYTYSYHMRRSEFDKVYCS